MKPSCRQIKNNTTDPALLPKSTLRIGIPVARIKAGLVRPQGSGTLGSARVAVDGWLPSPGDLPVPTGKGPVQGSKKQGAGQPWRSV